ncbi:MAG: ABC transporter ATP-binding protein [Bacillota bacterium]
MLEIKNLAVNYDHVIAITDVSFKVEKGTIVSIVGSNGAGKSTLLNTISGLVKKSSGQILLNNEPLPQVPHKVVKKGIIQIPEGRHVFPGLTVKENLIMGGCRISAKVARSKLDQMYELFPRLGERRNQLAGTLSGGEQQMLAIARGLMAEPEILMMDEPSLGLAPLIVAQVFDIIKNINKSGITILLIEQNAGQAMAISDMTYILENGRIVASGKSKELKNNDDIRKAYLGK